MLLTTKQATLAVIMGIFLALPLGMAERTINTAYKTVKATNAELMCLAKNIYYEARGEPMRGKIAVAQVTLNRVTHRTEFQSSICGVVYAKHQFSWTNERHKEPCGEAWREAKEVAKAVLDGSVHIPQFKALYFHNLTVQPRWRKTKELVARIGNHIFYA
jgi:spore germination cell wall hydrolase CwlJ-like protein